MPRDQRLGGEVCWTPCALSSSSTPIHSGVSCEASVSLYTFLCAEKAHVGWFGGVLFLN